jgi:hypothetical protein
MGRIALAEDEGQGAQRLISVVSNSQHLGEFLKLTHS